jgi:putative addiction module CopG family antidote
MISAKVDSSRYKISSEVVREALRILEEKEREQRLRHELLLGLQAVEKVRTVPYASDLFERLKSEAIRPVKAGLPISDVFKP